MRALIDAFWLPAQKLRAARWCQQVSRLALSLLCSAAMPVVAQDIPEAQQARATQHFERGVDLYKEGDAEAALVELERAYELYPSYVLLYNLAQLQAERLEYVIALDLYHRYLREGGDRIARERRVLVEQEIARLQRRVGTLWVSSNVEGAAVYVDGKQVGTTPLRDALRVNSGFRRLRLAKEGYRSAREELKVAGGDRLRASMPLLENTESVPVTETPRAPRLAPKVSDDYTPLWISVGVAGVLMASTVTFGVLATRSDSEIGEELSRIPVDRARLESARSRTRDYAALADGFAIATAVAAGLAVYFLVDPPVSPTTASQSRFRLQPNGIIGTF